MCVIFIFRIYHMRSFIMIIRVSCFFYYALRRNRKLNAFPLIHCTINSSLIIISCLSSSWKCRFVSTLTFMTGSKCEISMNSLCCWWQRTKKNEIKPDYIFLNWSFHSNCTICESFFFATIDKCVSRHLKMVIAFFVIKFFVDVFLISFLFRFVFALWLAVSRTSQWFWQIEQGWCVLQQRIGISNGWNALRYPSTSGCSRHGRIRCSRSALNPHILVTVLSTICITR